MHTEPTAAVEALIEQKDGGTARVSGGGPAGGGCIHDARFVELTDGRRYFVKTGSGSARDIFEREAESLRALGEVGVLPVPRVLGTDRDVGRGGRSPGRDARRASAGNTRAGKTSAGNTRAEKPDTGKPGGVESSAGSLGATHFLLLEAVETGPRPRGFSEAFGSEFAEHHRASAGRSPGGRYGFDHDNYLGATPQPNAWTDSWVDFWRRHRLGHQLELARGAGRSDPELERLGDRLLDRLDDRIGGNHEGPCLLHGDLWGGNYLVRSDGRAVLIDPATYHGHREADLAMTRLFGGFDAAFYRAYEEMWPLEPGSEERLAVYELYHLLNHLNLFGRSYRSGCVARLKRLV